MRNIIILGGGSSGWMTANYLAYHNKDINIKVISSSSIPTIGVGESTTPHLVRFLHSIGITEEKDWMPYCNATYKNGVLYEDWDFINSRWWHSFEVDEYKHFYWKLNAESKGLDRQDYFISNLHSGSIAMRDSHYWLSDKDNNKLIPKYFLNNNSNINKYYGWPQNWAYHLDSDMFGTFLKNRIINMKNVEHFDRNIIKCDVGETGIEKIISECGEEFTADLFIDCTGFNRYLIDKIEGNQFNTFDPYLTHDKACVIRYDYVDKESEMKPRTRTKALSSGWVWEIPLYDKISVGYVYTSDYITDEEAENELRRSIGKARLRDYKSFTIDIKTGYYSKPFIKNVVSVGLSSGFIEPLEATLLLSIQMSAEGISDFLKDDKSVEEYNNTSNFILKSFLNFISTNYYLSHRKDSYFWKSKGENTKLSPEMLRWIEMINKGATAPINTILPPSSWFSKLIGFNHYKINKNVKMSDDLQKQVMELNDKLRSNNTQNLLSQYEYLKKYIYHNSYK